ncbi:MAG: G/U mismatch-specific DNA glycosylase [Actinomycetota bacterium]
MAAADVRPTREQVAAAAGRTIPDVLAPGLDVVFCGINPGLYSGAVGHHFARPGNRFWKALHLGGFTDRVLVPSEDHDLIRYRCGLTNLVARATAGAAELGDDELREGTESLGAIVARIEPTVVAILGIGAYRTAFRERRAELGPQTRMLGTSRAWVLPNPSGRNAHHRLDDLGTRFSELRRAVGPI